MMMSTVHKKKSKKNCLQYNVFNKYSLFSTKSLSGQDQELGIESDEVLYIRTRNYTEVYDLQTKMFPNLQATTNVCNNVIQNQNNTDGSLFQTKKCIHFCIRIFIDYDDLYKIINTKGIILSSLNNNLDISLSSYLVIDKLKFGIKCISEMPNIQKLLYLFLAENNLRHTSNVQIARNNLSNIFVIVMNKITKINYFVPKTALSPMFYKWYFQNITQGLFLKSILRNINVNTISIICNQQFILYKDFIDNGVSISLYFISQIPDEFRYLNYCMQLIYNTTSVTTDKDQSFIIEMSRKVDNEEIGTTSLMEVLHESTQTDCIQNYEEILIDSSTYLENDFVAEEEVKVQEMDSLKSLNSSLWLPKLCGDSSDNKISFISYVMKCSCLNEALVNLDAAESYIRTTYNIVFSPTFNKVFFKDLAKSLLSLFTNSVI